MFISARLSGDSLELVCLGVTLPTDGHHAIASFDRIRAALNSLPSDTPPASGETADRSRQAESKRRWWQRRG
ncbi:hypothetical protein QF026_005750 [Streptomyces aurantiacus]|nr:hypothetical protein [Streptomyces aurantiacus]